jgi:Xaa-Pro aminopeptidase
MHRTGHWLGLDVHDPGVYKTGDQWRVLEPGMVMTVEPGIYVGSEDESRFRNIGVRIEDDVLVSQGDPVVLTEACPKTISELESIIGTSTAPLF